MGFLENISPLVFLCFIFISLASTKSSSQTNCIIDITHLTHDNMTVWRKSEGAGQIITEFYGQSLVTGELKLGTHYGTHVDSPSHVPELASLGIDVAALHLETLIGPVLVVRVPDEFNITGEVLSSLDLPQGLKRVVFKTKNSDRHLMNQTAFASDYTGFTLDGAQWLVANTKVKFVGIDYLSIAAYDYLVPVHVTLMNKTGIIPVECLNLDHVEPGRYNVYCLPLKVKADGAPVRCILMKQLFCCKNAVGGICPWLG